MPIDTHAHLFDDRFADDIDHVINRAIAAGLSGILAVGIDANSNRPSVTIAKRYPDMIRVAIGIQPNHVAEMKADDWGEVVRLAETEPLVTAIGETGLDRHWDHTPFAMQEDLFARHLALSRRLAKPLVIHCRDAEADVVSMLRHDYERHGPILGVMHSFTGDLATAETCLAMGLHVSFAGMVTYKTGNNLREVARALPSERLLIETDCPYLAPQAVRGQRNEPAFVVHTLALLAEVRGVSIDDLDRHTTINARKLFGFAETESAPGRTA